MEKTLIVYSEGKVVGQQVVKDREPTSVKITGLTSGTTYPAGKFKVSYSNESGESEKVDVPEFTTVAKEVNTEVETGAEVEGQ